MNNKVSITLLVGFFLISCSAHKKDKMEQIKSIKETSFIVAEKFGEITKIGKGRRQGNDKLIIFNQEGNIAEEITYNIEGEQEQKSVWRYDSNCNVTEEIVYNSDDIIIKKHIYTYDNYGRLIESHQYDLTGLISKNIFIYDDEGNISTKIKYDANNNIIKKNSYKYNNVISLKEIDYYSNNGNLKTRTICKFDQHGDLVEMNRYDSDGSLLWKNTIEKRLYESYKSEDNYIKPDFDREFRETSSGVNHDGLITDYNDNGDKYVIKLLTFLGDISNPINNIRYIRLFDQNSDLVIFDRKVDVDKNLILSSYNYKYDNKRNLIEEVKYESGKRIWTLNWKYDENGVLNERTKTFPDGSFWRYTMEYDELGNLIHENWLSSENFYLEKRTLIYSGLNHLIERNIYYLNKDFSGATDNRVSFVPFLQWQHTLEYDLNGNLTKSIVSEYNARTTKNISYFYDEKGNLTSHRYASDTGFNYNYEYEFDEKGNWNKRYDFENFLDVPTYVIVREITYYE